MRRPRRQRRFPRRQPRRAGRRHAPRLRSEHAGRTPERQRRRPRPLGSSEREPNGPAFADPSATASSAACGSRPTGPLRRPSSCGASRSGRAGRPSRSAATSFIPRSSAATTRSSPVTTRRPASRCGYTATGPVLRVEWRRRSARDADGQRGSRVHVRRDRNPERARCRQRRRRVVAQRGVRHGRGGPDLGLLELAAGGRRHRRRRRGRPARRVRRRHRQAALVRLGRRRELQLAASGDDRRRHAGPDVERRRRDQRRARRRQACSGSTRGGAHPSCSRS